MSVKLTLFRRGLILVAVPLLFQLTLIGTVAVMQHQATEASVWVAHAKVIARAESLRNTLVDVESGSRGYALTKNPIFTKPYDEALKSTPLAIQEMKSFVKDNPSQSARVEVIAANTSRLMECHAKMIQEVRDGAAENPDNRLEGERRMDAIHQDVAAFCLEEVRLETEHAARHDQARQMLQRVLFGGAIAAVAITLLLAFVFSRGIGSRLGVLTENARRFAEGKELAAPVGGADEISEVDRAFRDLTPALVRAREDLRKSEANYRTIFDYAGDGIFIADQNARIVDVNSSGCVMMGYTRDELLARTIKDLIAAEEQPRLAPLLGRLLAGETMNMEWLCQRKDGTRIHGEFSAVMRPDGRLIGILHDLSERKRAEDRLRLVLDTALEAIIVMDEHGVITEWNPQAVGTFGWRREEAVGRSLAETIIPMPLREAHVQGLKRFLETGEGPVLNRYLELNAVRQDGREIPVELTIRPMVALDRVSFSGFLRDITERKRAEDRLRLIVEASTTGMVLIGRNGHIVMINRTTEELFGYERSELIGQTVEKLIPQRFAKHHPLLRDTFFKHPAKRSMGKDRELFGIRKDGSEFPVELGLSPIEMPDGLMVMASVDDVTERKQVEADIRRLNEELEGRVEQRTAELRTSNQHLENRIQVAEFANAMMLSLTGSDNVQVCLEQCAQHIVTYFDAAFARVWILNEAENVLELQVSAGMYTHINGPHARVPVGMFKIGLIAQERKPHLTNDVPHDLRVSDQEWARREGMVAFAGYPLLLGNRLIGVLALFARHPLAQLVLDALASVADSMALAIDNKRTKTELNLSENKLHQIESQIHLLVENVQDYAIVLLDPTGCIATWNAGAERINGYCADEIVGQHFSRVYPAEDAETGKPEHELKVALEKGRFEAEGWRVRKDGTRFWANVIITAIKDDTGRLRGFSNITRDITERKHAEAKLQQQLARLRLITQITQFTGEQQDLQSIYRVVLAQLEDHLQVDFSALCSFDSQTNTLQVTAVRPKSQPHNAELGLDEQAIVPVDTCVLAACVRGETVYAADLAQMNAPVPKKLAQAGLRSLVAVPLGSAGKTIGVLLTARRADDGFSSADCEFLKQLGSHIFLATQHAHLYQDLKNAYDELHQSQKAVLQQERLHAVGQMASGIAHDINNAISPISIYSEALLDGEPNLSPRAREYLTTIAQAIEDVAQTVSRMRDFHREQDKQITLDPVNLNPLVRQVLDQTRAKWRDQAHERGITIDVKTDLAQNLPTVMGVENELRDALTNLIFNAVDAMPQGGTLTIRTRPGAKTEVDGRGNFEEPTHVILDVADTGIGMNEDIRQRCLEPFFTTKGERGTGLGLAMVYGAMQRHSGEIDIKSAPGVGTTIRLLFPWSKEVVDARDRGKLMPGKTEPLRILLVDDDALLRKSLQDTLQGDGHQVTVADGGQAGIDAFLAAHQRGQRFEIVITDLGMPYTDGRAVAQAVKAKSPATAVIMLTGWGERMKAEGNIPVHVDRVLAKPPKLRELREALAVRVEERRTPDDKP